MNEGRADVRGRAVANVWTVFIGMGIVIAILVAANVYLYQQVDVLFNQQNQTIAHNHQTGLAILHLQRQNHDLLCQMAKQQGLETTGDC